MATPQQAGVETVYDQRTGRLQLVKYDSNADGRPDSWTYTEGSQILRMEVDSDRDGKVDRWQYYDRDRKVTKIGLSTQNDGQEDRWIYLDSNGATSRVESRLSGNAKARRVEYFEKSLMSRAEEDSDGDGQTDKWETYDGARLALVAFDSERRGVPNRRLLYDVDGTVRIEVDLRGDGHFVPASGAAADESNRRGRQR